MGEQHGKARHRRSRKALAAGEPLALTAAGAFAYGTDLGLFGADSQARASTPSGRTALTAAVTGRS